MWFCIISEEGSTWISTIMVYRPYSWWMASLVFGIVSLTLAASAACPDGCRCFTNPASPQNSQVQCDEGTHIPSGLGNVSVLNLNGNSFHNSVLSRANFSALKNLVELSLSGCGIQTIQPNTFIGKLNC